MEPELNGIKRDEQGRIVKGSAPLNPDGRPEGSVSVITKLKQKFQENPAEFDEFIERYRKNPLNERHLVEMIDGKPQGKVDVTTNGESLTPLLVKFIDEPEDSGDTD